MALSSEKPQFNTLRQFRETYQEEPEEKSKKFVDPFIQMGVEVAPKQLKGQKRLRTEGHRDPKTLSKLRQEMRLKIDSKVQDHLNDRMTLDIERHQRKVKIRETSEFNRIHAM